MLRFRPLQFLCVFTLAASATAALADNPFVGEWKQNNEKSRMTGDIIRYSPAPDGAIKFTAEDRSYTFKTDGKEYTGPTGAQNVWKMMDESNYQRSSTRNGVPRGTTIYKISADGKTMVVEETGTRPGGKAFDDTATYIRVAGAKGLMGSWKSTDVTLKEDFTMSLKPGSTPDSMRWELPDMKAFVNVSYDGKECVPVGPTIPKGLTLSLTKTGPRSLLMIEKLDGKMLNKSTYKLSADGKTLTQVETPPDGKAPATFIYERQAM